MANITPPPVLYTVPAIIDSKINLESSGILIPDGMIAKIAGSNQFKVGQGDKTWNELEFANAHEQVNPEMSIAEFNLLLKQSKVSRKLTEYTNFYVDDVAGSDVISVGIGETMEKPFKTIQACINYICENYNLGVYDLYINVAPGTYTNEQLELLNYDTNRGVIVIRPTVHSETNRVIIKNTNKYFVNASFGGIWHIRDIDFEFLGTPEILPTERSGTFSLVMITYGTSLSLQSCSFKCKFEGLKPSNKKSLIFRIFNPNVYARLQINISTIGPFKISAETTDTSAAVFRAFVISDDAELRLCGNSNTNAFPCETYGNFNIFLEAWNRGKVINMNWYNKNYSFIVPEDKEITCIPYSLGSGATLTLGGVGLGLFPGNTDGVIAEDQNVIVC